MSAFSLEVTPGPARLSRDLRPIREVAVFCFAFMVLSLCAAAPIAWATGRTVLGIWFILPFTVGFVFVYQRHVHGEALAQLGVHVQAREMRHAAAGFLGCGAAVSIIQAVQIHAGWMEVRSVAVAAVAPSVAATGVGLALALNLGIGFGEELIYRGYILHRLLLGCRTITVPVSASAAIFSLSHLPKTRDPLTLTNLLLLGVVLALAVVLTRSLWASIGLHMGWDFWRDGIYFFRFPGGVPARIFSFDYHLATREEVLAFRILYTIALLLAAGVLAARTARRAAVSVEPAKEVA